MSSIPRVGAKAALFQLELVDFIDDAVVEFIPNVVVLREGDVMAGFRYTHMDDDSFQPVFLPSEILKVSQRKLKISVNLRTSVGHILETFEDKG